MSEEIKCPFCGSVQYDDAEDMMLDFDFMSYEIVFQSEDFECECSECKKKFTVTVSASAKYNTKIKKGGVVE